MLSCAVCDDDQSAANVLRSRINEYSAELDCAVFFDPRVLLSAVENGQRFDIYILDIIMPELSGIELARAIRQADNNGVIIFLTGADEFHKEAFDVEALQYLDKPVDKEHLYRAVDRALRYIGDESDGVLPVETKTGLHALQINQIVYAESYRHKLTLHLCDGSEIETLDSSLTLKKLAESLQFPPFYVPYRGFIINFSYVECLKQLQFFMASGAVIPIPQKQFAKIRRQYSDYLLSRYAKGED